MPPWFYFYTSGRNGTVVFNKLDIIPITQINSIRALKETHRNDHNQSTISTLRPLPRSYREENCTPYTALVLCNLTTTIPTRNVTNLKYSKCFTLHVKECVHWRPVSSTQTPQCLSASNSRSGNAMQSNQLTKQTFTKKQTNKRA